MHVLYVSIPGAVPLYALLTGEGSVCGGCGADTTYLVLTHSSEGHFLLNTQIGGVSELAKNRKMRKRKKEERKKEDLVP